MELPFFYITEYLAGDQEITLDEDNSRHVVQVLRMETGERLRLTDGKGHLVLAVIADAHKKKCRVRVESVETVAARAPKVVIAISILKNASRFEWFLEKATEMGVSGIAPLLCERTERSHFRLDRMKGILVSAMLQSQQCWLPTLTDPMPFREVMAGSGPGSGRKLIAHCLEEERLSLAGIVKAEDRGDTLILIGPEGDFSKQEIDLALGQHFKAVTLGETRLRTETAGVVAAALLCVS